MGRRGEGFDEMGETILRVIRGNEGTWELTRRVR